VFSALRRRLQAKVQAWMRPRQAEMLPVRLTRQRIYVLPTASGLFFGFVLGTMMLGALNYNNNPALLLAFIVAGAAQASLFGAHMQLSGVVVTAMAADPVPAGEPLHVRIALARYSRMSLLTATAAPSICCCRPSIAACCRCQALS
jgi:hypothetical protein